MTLLPRLAATAVLSVLSACTTAPHPTAAPVFQCTHCDEWNQPQQPFNVAANTWYVGTQGLSALLITGPQGHILLDGALPQSAAQIERNIAALGFRIEDVKLIVNSHAHFDHAGGIAALQARSGAQVATSAHGAQVLRDGVIGKDDPQYVPGDDPMVAKVPGARGVADGETLRVGPLAITAHLTPGHTPGSTTWTWTSCDAKGCLNMVYADSVTAVSADGFRFAGARAAEMRSRIDKIAALPCDVIVSTHPDFTGTFDKLAARTPAHNTFITPDGCRQYAAEAHQRLDARLASEQAGVPAPAPGH